MGPLLDAPPRTEEQVAVLAYRLDKLEEAAKPAPKPRKDVWERLQAIGPLVTGVVVALLGYWLTGSVTTALQRQELQLSNAREMRELVTTLFSAESTSEQVDVAALTMAAFGAPAVAPLVSGVLSGEAIRRDASERALRVIGLSSTDAVCEPMIRVLDNHTGRFSWLSHLSAIRVLGDLECRSAQPVLQRYAQLLDGARAAEGLAQYARVVDAEPPVDLAAVEQLRAEMARALRIVRQH